MTPQTAFEANGGTAWTTLAQEAEFMSLVRASSTRVTSVLLGASFNGLPIHAHSISVTGAPVLEHSDGLVIVASQHGFEPSGRESALQLIRDLAVADDPATVALLARHPVIVVPTASPDGTLANSRFNGNGDDPNRFHISLKTPESRAIAALLRHSRPVMVLDAHESVPVDQPGQKGWTNSATFTGLNAQQRTLGVLVEDTTKALFPAGGIGNYPLDDSEGTLTSLANRSGIAVLLFEVLDALPAVEKVTMHRTVMGRLVRYVDENHATFTSARAAAEVDYIESGYAAHAPVSIVPGLTVPAPVGYVVPGYRAEFALHGLTTHEVGPSSTELYLPMDQPRGQILPALLDPRAPAPIMVARAVENAVGAEPVVNWLTQPSPVEVAPSVAFLKDEKRQPVRRITSDGHLIWGY